MNWLNKKITAFFAWWEDVSKLETKSYDRWPYSVNWPIVTFAVIVMITIVTVGLVTQ